MKEELKVRLKSLEYRIDSTDLLGLYALKALELEVLVACLGGWHESFLISRIASRNRHPAISLRNGLRNLDDKLQYEPEQMIEPMIAINSFKVLIAICDPKYFEPWFPFLAKSSTNIRCLTYQEALVAIPTYYK